MRGAREKRARDKKRKDSGAETMRINVKPTMEWIQETAARHHDTASFISHSGARSRQFSHVPFEKVFPRTADSPFGECVKTHARSRGRNPACDLLSFLRRIVLAREREKKAEEARKK